VDNNGNYREGWEKQVPAFRHTTKRQLLFDRALFNRAPFYYSLKRLFPNFIVRPGVDHVFICLLLILQKVKYLCCIRIGVEQSGNFCSGHIRDALICMDKPQPSCATAWLISCVSPGQGRRLTTDALQPSASIPPVAPLAPLPTAPPPPNNMLAAEANFSGQTLVACERN
jgi:hypothetical protein